MAQPSDNAASSKLPPLRFALVAALIVILSAPAYYLLEYWPHRAGMYPPSPLEVPQGASLNQIANELAQLGVIENRVFFVSTLVCLTSIEDCRQEDTNCQRTSLRQKCLRFCPVAKSSNMQFDCPKARTCEQ